METQLLRAEDPGALDHAAELLRQGELVAFPTETVYGLGALGLDAAAVERIFQAKGRPHADPIILHVAEPEAVLPLVRQFSPTARLLAGAFWPGPLTLVLPKSELVPDIVTSGLDSVALRMPAHPVARALIGRVGAPVAAPSANLFSHTSPTRAEHVLADLHGRIAAVLDGGPTDVGVESTVVDLRGDRPVLLRPGGVSREALEAVLGAPLGERPHPAPEEETAAMVSPGLLTRHYSPRAEMRLFQGDPESVVAAQLRLARSLGVGIKLGVLAYTEDLPAWQGNGAAVSELGAASDPETVARRLYAALRDLDQRGATLIVGRLLPGSGLAEAINDRLRRAASGQLTEVGDGVSSAG